MIQIISSYQLKFWDKWWFNPKASLKIGKLQRKTILIIFQFINWLHVRCLCFDGVVVSCLYLIGQLPEKKFVLL
jgi:hypothetical protein